MVAVEPEDASYEWLRDRLSTLAAAKHEGERDLVWVDGQKRLAVARDVRGRVEVFVVGPPLTAHTRIVKDSLEHESWTTSTGSALPANRVVLPLAPHFDEVAAFLCTELINNGVQGNAQTAFDRTEPLLALALTRTQLADQVLLGLFGELALLEALLSEAPSTSSEVVMTSWAGSSPSARDFQLENVGVEVKTTTSPASVHHVQGVHQVELGHSNSGAPESHLFLLSLGLTWVTEDDGGRTIPDMVDSVLELVTDVQVRTDFLARIKQYGGDAAIGYDHEHDRDRPRYTQRFSFRFERLYDMTDPRIRVLRSADLVGLSELDPSSVTFRVQLPNHVRGELNPVTGWRSLAATILKVAASG
jgi:hypothetical protein